jgi:hypothetical protein
MVRYTINYHRIASPSFINNEGRTYLHNCRSLFYSFNFLTPKLKASFVRFVGSEKKSLVAYLKGLKIGLTTVHNCKLKPISTVDETRNNTKVRI